MSNTKNVVMVVRKKVTKYLSQNQFHLNSSFSDMGIKISCTILHINDNNTIVGIIMDNLIIILIKFIHVINNYIL